MFAKEITITLSKQYRVPSNVTINGRCHKARLLDYGLTISRGHNIIVTHLTIDGESKYFSQAFNIGEVDNKVMLMNNVT